MEQDFLSPSLVMLLGVFVYGETLSAERLFVCQNPPAKPGA
ncbi:hypothetical protein [uncultured Bilophila sp.]|nr:hypothetical protein [uncultured Bilophila sp.]